MDEMGDIIEQAEGVEPMAYIDADGNITYAAIKEATENEEPLIQTGGLGYNSNASGVASASGPIEAWHEALHSHSEQVEPIEVPDLSQLVYHQTLVLIEASSKSRNSFKERALRFISGLNTESTIKATVVTIADGKMYAGLTFEGEKSGGLNPEIAKGKWNLVIRITDKDS